MIALSRYGAQIDLSIFVIAFENIILSRYDEHMKQMRDLPVTTVDGRVESIEQRLGDRGALKTLVLDEETTVQNQAYQALRQALMSGRLRPGEEVSLRQAAAALRISVTPVREALRRIESEGGLVVHGKNRVLRVPIISPEELLEIRNIRLTLEGMAVQAAAHNMSRQQMRLITNACALMQEAAEARDADRYLEHNWRFHSLIHRTADMPILLSLIEGMWIRVGSLIRLALQRPAHFDKTMAFHWQAERALRAGDAAAACDAIGRDISEAADDLAAALEGRHPRGVDDACA